MSIDFTHKVHFVMVRNNGETISSGCAVEFGEAMRTMAERLEQAAREYVRPYLGEGHLFGKLLVSGGRYLVEYSAQEVHQMAREAACKSDECRAAEELGEKRAQARREVESAQWRLRTARGAKARRQAAEDVDFWQAKSAMLDAMAQGKAAK